jgi:spore germination protein YaaH
MKLLGKILVATIILLETIVIVIISVLAVSTYSELNTLKQSFEAEKPAEKVDLIMDVSVHLVGWDQVSGFKVIQSNQQLFDTVTPFWYELNVDGEVSLFNNAEDEHILEYLRESNTKVTPIVSNEYRKEPLSSIIASRLKRSNHIDDIINIVDLNNYDGISIDYENLDPEDKDNFTEFITELSTSLHENEKTLTVHLHAKTEEPGSWNGPQSQDWEELGKVCDKLKIMAYGYHWSTSEAGAIAPVDWVEDVVEHALDLIPREKIYLGIPLYGYDWIEKLGTSVVYDRAIKLSDKYGQQIIFDNSDKTPYFRYDDADDNLHEVWFENAESVKYKLELAKLYELAGVDFWRIGGEDSEVWTEVRDVLQTSE